MRTGLWVSGAGGSGVLVARKEDGTWSPPSGILLHTAGLGFLIGVDIYDCVVVINTEKALEAFTKIRCTLGGEVSAVAGPVGVGGIMETEVHKRQAPVWNYLKSRGFYAGVQIDGTVIIERQDENERFYGEKLSVAEILSGQARHPPYEIKTLMATVKAAQGDQDVDESALPAAGPTPGDFEIQDDASSRFGLPPSEDNPDPFGVKALEEEGMEIKEVKPSGHKSRPSMEAFEYRPAPSSPIFTAFSRSDSAARRQSNRASRDSGRLSIASADRGTQTADLPPPPSPKTLDSPTSSRHNSPIKMTENLAEDLDEEDLSHSDHHEEHHQQPVIIEKAKLVTIPKRIPPTLPPRSPYRSSQQSATAASQTPASPTVTQHHSPDTLAVNTTTRAAAPTAAESAGIHLSPSEDRNLSTQLTEIHLTPQRDPDRLSPSHNNDGFDNVSIDGSSSYSKETPAETPIRMADNEIKDGLAGEGRLEKETENEKPGLMMGGESEDFHSMPGTPLEGVVPQMLAKEGPFETAQARVDGENRNFS